MGVRLLLIGMFLLAYAFHTCQFAQIADVATLTHSVARRDVTSYSFVIWSRTNHEVYLHVAYESDYTGQVMLNGLQPSTHYYYRVWLTTEPAGN
jgi:phosphodiesterase/alkaline phosphatase D-like protein